MDYDFEIHLNKYRKHDNVTDSNTTREKVTISLSEQKGDLNFYGQLANGKNKSS